MTESSSARASCRSWSTSGRSGAGRAASSAPALEEAVRKREGEVELAKVDTDANQALAASFGIRGIPAVKAFRDGQVVDRVHRRDPAGPGRGSSSTRSCLRRPTGSPRPATRRRCARRSSSTRARRRGRARSGGILLARGDAEEAAELLEPLRRATSSPRASRRGRSSPRDGDGSRATASSPRRSPPGTRATTRPRSSALQDALAAEQDPDRRDLIRQVMVAIFTELGADHPLAREHRRRLAAALN